MRTLSTWELAAWCVGTIASSLMIGLFGQINHWLPLEFRVDAGVLGLAVMLPRIIDAAIDPLVGHLSDNTRSRWGRRKPYMLVGAIVGAGTMSLLWWIDPAWSSTAQFLWIFLLGTVFYVAWGLFSMAHTAFGMELTDDYDERNRVMAMNGLFQYLAWMGVASFYWLSLRPIFGDPVTGLRTMAGLMAVVVVICALVPILACRERFAATVVRGPTPHFWTAFREAAGNQPFLILLIAKILTTMTGLGAVAVGYYNLFHVCGGNKDVGSSIAPITQVVIAVISLAAIPLMPWVSRRIDKRQALIGAHFLAFLSALATPFLMQPGMPYLQLLPLFLIMPFKVFLDAQLNAINPDICDLDELEHGRRREGVFTSVLSFVSKLEISLMQGAAGFFIAWTGVQTGQVQQAPEVIHRLGLVAFIPSIGCAFLAFLVVSRFSITRQKMAEVRQELERRRAALLESPPTPPEHP